MLLCLNEGFEGGDIHFTSPDYTIKPSAGLLIAYPSHYRFQHAAAPVTSGTRYAIASFGAAQGTERTHPMPQGAVYLGQKR